MGHDWEAEKVNENLCQDWSIGLIDPAFKLDSYVYSLKVDHGV